jgi:hypothetical protein
MSLIGSLKASGEVHPIWIIRGIADAEEGGEENRQCDAKTDGEVDVSK